jgi:hypothetical protein
MPYVLKQFKVIGKYETLEKFGNEVWKPMGKDETPKKNEFPGSNVVVEFRAK